MEEQNNLIDIDISNVIKKIYDNGNRTIYISRLEFEKLQLNINTYITNVKADLCFKFEDLKIKYKDLEDQYKDLNDRNNKSIDLFIELTKRVAILEHKQKEK